MQSPTSENLQSDTKGLSSFDNIRLLELSDFDQIASDSSTIRSAPRSFRIGILRLKRLEALEIWVDDQINQGTIVNAIDYALFDDNVRNEYIALAVSAQKDDSGKDDVAFPAKFNPHQQWVALGRNVNNFLQTKVSEKGIPLKYVIRDPLKCPANLLAPSLTREEHPIWNASFTEVVYREDGKRVIGITFSLLLGKDEYVWIEKFVTSQNAQGTWASLRAFYDGPGMVTKRVLDAHRIIKDMTYNEEATYSFDTR